MIQKRAFMNPSVKVQSTKELVVFKLNFLLLIKILFTLTGKSCGCVRSVWEDDRYFVRNFFTFSSAPGCKFKTQQAFIFLTETAAKMTPLETNHVHFFQFSFLYII